MKLNDLRFDKQRVAQHIADWYGEVIDFISDTRKMAIDQMVSEMGIRKYGSPDELYYRLLELSPQQLSSLYRRIKKIVDKDKEGD